MDEPLIACICLTRDRPQYVARAIECYRSQTWKNKRLVVLDTGVTPVPHEPEEGILWLRAPQWADWPIGTLRNKAIEHTQGADFIAHLDDDDWSGPTRLVQQFASWSPAKMVVGYRDMVFYDQTQDRVLFYDSRRNDYALGTSLFYSREVWERKPFPDQTPEDTTWQQGLEVYGCSVVAGSPVMFQTIHGANASAHYTPGAFRDAPEHAAFVRQVLEWGKPLRPLNRREQFGAFVQEFFKQGSGVEVGTQYGVFAKQVSQDWKGRLVCVDIWPDRKIYEVCTAMLADQPNVVMWRKDSLTASEDFQDGGFDWVYIDADHHYEEVLADLEAWFPKLRKGGVMAGHDYVNYLDMGVIKAVNEFTAKRGYKINLTSHDAPFDGVRFPTWWFIK